MLYNIVLASAIQQRESLICIHVSGLPRYSAGKESTWFNSWVGKMPWRKARLSTPVFLGFPGAQAVKNLLAMWKIWVESLGWEDPLEEDRTIHSSILAWRIPMDREPWWAPAHGFQKVRYN